jgi:hypothetical protein
MLRGTVRTAQAARQASGVVVTWQTNVSIIGSANADHLNYTRNDRHIYGQTPVAGSCVGAPTGVLTVSVRVDSGSDAHEPGWPEILAPSISWRVATETLEQDGARSRALVELAVFNLQGAAVPDASLEVQPSERTIAQGHHGPRASLIPDIGAGVITIRARRIGFKPGEVRRRSRPGAIPCRSCSASWRRQRWTPFASSADGA